MRTKKEVAKEYKEAEKVLNDLIFSKEEDHKNRSVENVKKIIKQKKLVNSLGIKLWEFSL